MKKKHMFHLKWWLNSNARRIIMLLIFRSFWLEQIFVAAETQPGLTDVKSDGWSGTSDWSGAPKMFPSLESRNKTSWRQTQEHSAINNAAEAHRCTVARVHAGVMTSKQRLKRRGGSSRPLRDYRRRRETGGQPAPDAWQTGELHSFRKHAAATPACREY